MKKLLAFPIRSFLRLHYISRFILIGILILTVFTSIVLSFFVGRYFLFTIAVIIFWLAATVLFLEFYDKIYLPLELNRFAEDVDLSLLSDIFNKYARLSGVDENFECLPFSNIKTSRSGGTLLGLAPFGGSEIIIYPSTIITSASNKNIDEFVYFLSVFIHEQVHAVFQIHHEGVVERLSREILIDYVYESGISDEKLKEVLGAFVFSHCYNDLIGVTDDFVEDIADELELDINEAWHLLVGYFIDSSTLVGVFGNYLPPLGSVKKFYRECIEN